MRPTKEQVDAALTLAARHPSRAVNTLAAEVRALRSDEAAANEAALTLGSEVDRLQASVDLYRATFARVEALLPAWRDHDDYSELDCADDLEAALRGEP